MLAIEWVNIFVDSAWLLSPCSVLFVCCVPCRIFPVTWQFCMITCKKYIISQWILVYAYYIILVANDLCYLKLLIGLLHLFKTHYTYSRHIRLTQNPLHVFKDHYTYLKGPWYISRRTITHIKENYTYQGPLHISRTMTGIQKHHYTIYTYPRKSNYFFPSTLSRWNAYTSILKHFVYLSLYTFFYKQSHTLNKSKFLLSYTHSKMFRSSVKITVTIS